MSHGLHSPGCLPRSDKRAGTSPVIKSSPTAHRALCSNLHLDLKQLRHISSLRLLFHSSEHKATLQEQQSQVHSGSHGSTRPMLREVPRSPLWPTTGDPDPLRRGCPTHVDEFKVIPPIKLKVGHRIHYSTLSRDCIWHIPYLSIGSSR